MLKKYLLMIFYFLMTYIGIIKFFYWINRHKKLVVTYHNIIPDTLFDNSPHLGVSHKESIFHKQLKLIQKRFTTKKKNNRLMITFDDGYKNQLDIAAKKLNDFNLQGIFFISVHPIISGQTLIIDKVMMWVSYVPAGDYIILDCLTSIHDENRSTVASKLYEQLLAQFELWNIIINELNQLFPFDDLKIDPTFKKLRFEPFNINDIKTLIKTGHLVGMHSLDHRPLSTLPIEQQRNDFSLCYDFANQHGNSFLYSYPYGGVSEVSPLTAQLCEEYGFQSAFMNTDFSPNWSDVKKNYILPRIGLPNEFNSLLLDAKLSGFETFCKKIVNRFNQ